MGDLRKDLRAYFDALAAQVDKPATVDYEAGRRSVRSRSLRAAVVAFALIALCAGAIAAVVQVAARDDATTRSAQQAPTSAPPCNLGQTLPCDPGDGNLQLSEKVVVAEGDYLGSHWRLLAYHSEDGLCLDFTVGVGAAGSCGSGVPPRPIQVGANSSPGFGLSVDGFVRKDVARVRLELANGETIEIDPVGADAGFEANFFVAIPPPGIQVLRGIAVAADNREIGRDSPNPGLPPTEPTVSGTASATTTASPVDSDTQIATTDGCPVGIPLPPGDDAEAAAIELAVRSAERNGQRIEVLNVYPAQPPPPPIDQQYASLPFGQCDEPLVAERTWVVEINIPELLPSESLSKVQLFVARFDEGWKIWGTY